MGDDLDPLDDIFADEAVKNARAVGKFKPKAKFQPQKKDSAKTSVASSQAVQTVDSAPVALNEPVETSKSLEQCANVVSNDKADRHAFVEKSAGENADIFTELEALGDFPTTTDMECTVPPSEAVSLNIPNPETIGGRLETSVLSSAEDSTHTCKVADVPADPGLSAEVDLVTAAEPIVSSAEVHEDMGERELRREEMDVMESINMTELSTKSGQRTGKFQPKPKLKLQMQKKIREASESSPCSLGSQSVPPETDNAESDSVPTFQQDDVLDLSSLGFTHTLPTEASSELPSNEESTNLMEMAHLESCIHQEGLPEIPAKLASRRSKTGSSKTHAASDPSPQQQKASTSSQDNGTGRSLRPRKGKSNFCELVDEDADEVLATGEISEPCPPSSAMEEENVTNEEFQVESEFQKKKLKRKSKKTDDSKEKPARKSKKAKEASDQETGAKHKKFSHSTRRRRVDKTLLETPEEEFDYSKVPLRDLILLAEHKERQTKKEGAAAGGPPANQSTGNSSGRYNDENLTSEQGVEYNDQQRSPTVEDTTPSFNYHTYMERTPSTRWSKQDTELFYEAVRQFGTDLSMIQKLFPDRSRRQIKLKYKKEERQHPLRLREALTNRSKDHSYFEKVIEHLKKIAAEENQKADKDDVEDLTGNGGTDEGTSNADDDEVKGEHIEEEENEDVANDFTDAQSPLKSDDDEDELLRWSQYKSDI